MDERKAFEAWARKQFNSTAMRDMRTPDGDYVYLQAEWLAWQAATAAERERAAKVCDALYLDWLNGDEHAMFDAAAAIRKG